MNIVGIGNCGCSIAKCFEQYPEYSTYYIDTQKWENTDKSYVLEEQENPEDYEEKCPILSHFFSKISGKVLFIVGGSGMISGSTLRILEQIKHCQISILYVQPGRDFLFGKQLLQERTTFGVFQEFARSGLLERLYLVNNINIEENLGDITVSDYFTKINEAISSVLHMIHVWQHSKPVMGNISKPADAERISTFGVMDVDTGVEKMFFDLQNITDKNIFYAINENSLKNENQLHSRIRQQIKVKMLEQPKTTFGIYPTDYSGSQAYVLAHTKIVQENDIDA